MKWEIFYLPEAQKDLQALDGSQRKLILKALQKVRQNPLSIYDGGYGKPHGNMNGNDLTGFLKVKLKACGLRIVYKLIQVDDAMLIVVIGAREDAAVYEIAQKRIKKHEL